ncbi:hypothetical protein KZP23_15000 [Echinicola marina]|uniref:hypothetical protein n=1 Tax=Echinicola marina TaxID=2859768 RepID=UPI001CF659DB|nr:hypothetical protein [Echinicola marina]UCS92023.1 hypothetical protein KZP23_15000 [Echinicola marina]
MKHQPKKPRDQGLLKQLLYNFQSKYQRSPTSFESLEIAELAKLLSSPKQAIIEVKITHFELVRSVMDSSVLEYGLSDLDTKIIKWAGIYFLQNQYIFIQVEDPDQKPSLNIQVLGNDSSAVPLLIQHKIAQEFWQEFEWLYHHTIEN